MKKTYTLMAALVLALAAKAQSPSYTSADFVQIGAVEHTGIADTTGFSIGSSGANQTWHVTITPTGTVETSKIVSPSTTQMGSMYPTATAAATAYGVYGYYKLTSSAMTVVGEYDSTAGITTTYTTPQEEYPFPMTYNTAFNNVSFAGSTSSGYIVSGTASGIVDAYGTLVINGQTFNNVLRYKYTSVTLDSFPSVGGFTTTSVTYLWFTPSQPQALLTYITSSEAFSGLSTDLPSALQYNDDALKASGIDNINTPISIRSIAPNPCTEQTTLTTNMTETANTQLMVYDVMGRLVWSQDYEQLDKGMHTFTINTSDLTAGMYMIVANTNNNRYTLGKFVKQ